MKRVAIVGADFAPSSYPPALRIRFFAQHLPEFGYEPIIVTTQPKYYLWQVDKENNNLVPEGLKVIRTAALKEKYTRPLGIGDVGIRSMGRHWRTISRLCRQKRIDLLYIPVPPYVPMVLGRLAHLRFGIPYVIDYIDPWVIEYYWKLPKEQRPPKWALSYAMSRVLEPFALKNVSHITGVARGYMDGVVKSYDWITEDDITGIPYGGEGADFEYLRRHPRRNPIFQRNDGTIHLSYVGRGGPDMLPTLRALFEAVKLGLQRSPDLFGRLKMYFVGTTYAADAEGQYQVLPLAREIGVEAYVEEHPARVPYLDALQILLDSHALLAIGSEEPYYTASKIFPNILANRPLLAIFHEESTVVTMVRETGAGEVVTFNAQNPPIAHVEKIAERLHALLTLPPGHRPATQWDAFEPYTTRSMTQQLAKVFDGVLNKGSH
jgi:hypothetical protein